MTPLHIVTWFTLLSHSLINDAEWVIEGLRNGFFLGIQASHTRSAKRNCRSAYEHPFVINNYLQEELSAGTMAGPFSTLPLQDLHINRFGVIPKSTPGKFRLITDLSFPHKASVNDLISDSEAAVSYSGIPEALKLIMSLGAGCLLAKFDISRAYRLLPIHPSLYRYFGMLWEGKYYLDLALPFGLRSAPSVFTRFADVLQKLFEHEGHVPHILHYLDDFLIVGAPASTQAQDNLQSCERLCEALGVPLAKEKTEGPATSITFLGFTLDTVKLELRLPPTKLNKIRSSLSHWLHRRSCTKRELLSLIGTLQHCCQAIVHGRPFLRRLIDRSCLVDELHLHVPLSLWEREDIAWWIELMNSWNGRSLFYFPTWERAPDTSISSDAAGAVGFAAINRQSWFAAEWPPGTENLSISVKELLPIVLAAHIWGNSWSRKRIVFKCDNLAVVMLLCKGSCRDRHLAFLLRELTMRAILCSFTFYAVHIPGKINVHADLLSRLKLQEFRRIAPDAASASLVIPPVLLQKLLCPPWMLSGKRT